VFRGRSLRELHVCALAPSRALENVGRVTRGHLAHLSPLSSLSLASLQGFRLTDTFLRADVAAAATTHTYFLMASRFPLLFLVIYLILPLPMSSSFSPQAQEPPRQALAAHAGLASSNHARLASEKVAIIGSGNWGTAIARIVGANTRAATAPVKMWVFEEDIDGRPLR